MSKSTGDGYVATTVEARRYRSPRRPPRRWVRRGGRGIADRIRAAKSPIVREVDLSPANFWQGSGDAVHVYLTDAATDQEALDLWCTVVYPPTVDRLPVGQVVLYKGGELQQGGGRLGVTLVLRDPTCPG